MGLGTKNRQKQTADICKQHLQEKYRDQLGLVEEFIVEIEGVPKNCDVTRWGQFTDIKDIKKEMFKRLEVHFENWLNPWAFFVRRIPRAVGLKTELFTAFALAMSPSTCC